MDLSAGLRGFREWKRVLLGLFFSPYKTVRIPLVASAAVQATILVIPAGAIIEGVFLRVDTAEATGTTKTIDVGISGGDEDGFIDGLSVAAAGTIKPTLADGAATLGVLLSVDESGGDLVPEGYVCAAATTICYTLAAADYEELDCTLFVKYVDPS